MIEKNSNAVLNRFGLLGSLNNTLGVAYQSLGEFKKGALNIIQSN